MLLARGAEQPHLIANVIEVVGDDAARGEPREDKERHRSERHGRGAEHGLLYRYLAVKQ
jgi:hypothetical protein